MRKTWATSGLDLHLDVAGSRVRAALEIALRDAVTQGRLPARTRLPSSRALAADLGIARNTVAEAYSQLVAEGWLIAAHGSGTFVADRPDHPSAPPGSTPGHRADVRFDLRPGSPDPSSFPRSAWVASMRKALRQAPDHALGYGDPRGVLELRSALTAYLARARGVRTDPDCVIVCSGFAQSLWALFRALQAQGATTVGVEEYSLETNREVAEDAGLVTRAVAVDDEGAMVDGLPRDGSLAAVVLTPAHQFPLGVVLSPARRAGMVEWAGASGGLVVEDDYDGEFRYDRQPVGALQGLAPERVAYIGTASKTLAPGLRLAWLVAPAHLVDQVVRAKLRSNRQSSTVDQLALATFIADGGYDRHVRGRRIVYRRRRDLLVDALARLPGEARVTGIAAGLQAVVELPSARAEDTVIAAAAHRGLALDGLRAYGHRSSGGRPPSLVVGYGGVPEHAYPAALQELAAVLGGGRAIPAPPGRSVQVRPRSAPPGPPRRCPEQP